MTSPRPQARMRPRTARIELDGLKLEVPIDEAICLLAEVYRDIADKIPSHVHVTNIRDQENAWTFVRKALEEAPGGYGQVVILGVTIFNGPKRYKVLGRIDDPQAEPVTP